MTFIKAWQSVLNSKGASYNVNTGELNPTSGYMVAIDKKFECTSPIPKTSDEFMGIVRAFFAEFYEHLFYDNVFMGFWINEGIFYIDLTENVKDFEEAYTKAFDKEQLAIYDCKNKRDIKITYLYPY